MDKRIKWGIIVVIGAGVIALGIHTFTPGKMKNWKLLKSKCLPANRRHST